MGKKYIEFEVLETKEVHKFYEVQSPITYSEVVKIIENCELPYYMRGGEIKILGLGEDDE